MNIGMNVWAQLSKFMRYEDMGATKYQYVRIGGCMPMNRCRAWHRLRSIWRVRFASVAMNVLCICVWFAQVMGPHPLQEFQSLFAGSLSSAMDLWPGWPANAHPRNVLGTVSIYICDCKCNQSRLTQPHKRLDQPKSIKCKHQQTCVAIQLGNALPLARDIRTAPLSDV